MERLSFCYWFTFQYLENRVVCFTCVKKLELKHKIPVTDKNTLVCNDIVLEVDPLYLKLHVLFYVKIIFPKRLLKVVYIFRGHKQVGFVTAHTSQHS